jgi:transcriptional regulator with XRE-family HTH domain
MLIVSAVSRQLKQLRQKAGLSIREVAQALGMEHGSSYQHYEDRYKKPLLPLDLVRRLVPIFARGGVASGELFELAGVTAVGERPLPYGGGAPDAGMLRIEELDLRAEVGHIDQSTSVVAQWQVPTGLVRGYSTSPARELRIITVVGDSMEPMLQPGQRVLVDIGDRKPSPSGIFLVWDGQGLVIKRLQMLPHSEPPRVRLTSDKPTYAADERLLNEAHIQGRIIGQWRWL